MRYFAHRFMPSPPPRGVLQRAYEARRAARRVVMKHYLATRELPGTPPPFEAPEEIMASLARPHHGGGAV